MSANLNLSTVHIYINQTVISSSALSKNFSGHNYIFEDEWVSSDF